MVNDGNDPTKTVRYLFRLGYDNIAGYLSGGMLSWHTSGKVSSSIETITVQEMCNRLEEEKDSWILDVRSDKEVKKAEITDSHNIHLTQIPENLDEIPKDEDIYIFCGSGLRATTAASLLKKKGWENITVLLGGTAGWNSNTCPIK